MLGNCPTPDDSCLASICQVASCKRVAELNAADVPYAAELKHDLFNILILCLLRSVTYSAVNALAGHFSSFGLTAPVPKKRLERIQKVSFGLSYPCMRLDILPTVV